MLYVFDDFALDTSVYELRRTGAVVPLEPQAFDVLTHLVAHRDRVVPKEELMDEVWGGRFVSEAAVTSRIKQVRRALDDDGRTQRMIRTVHGRGYRFVARTDERPSAGEPAPGPARGASPAVATSEPTTETTPPRARPTSVRYVESDGLNIAYQLSGGGDRDIVLVSGFISHLELDWADPRHAHFLDRLGSFGRLIRFDKRGTGMSDRPVGLPDLETRMHDVLAVMDAVGSERAVLVGYSEGGPMATLMAATHPERVSGLVLYGAYAKRAWAEDYPWARTLDERAAFTENLATGWDWEADMYLRCPSADAAMAQWWAARARAATTPTTLRSLMAMNTLVDVRDALPSVRVPTLVLHRSGDAVATVEEGRYLADNIPGARFVELPGEDHFVSGGPDQILDPIESFLTESPAPAPSLALGAIVALIGPGAASVAGDLALAGARNGWTADGRRVLVYDGPATAIRGVQRRLSQATSPEVSAGLHIAEVRRHGVAVDGPGVSTAVRLAEIAPAGELWVSATVRDLVSGSGLTLAPSGEQIADPDGARPVFRVLADATG